MPGESHRVGDCACIRDAQNLESGEGVRDRACAVGGPSRVVLGKPWWEGAVRPTGGHAGGWRTRPSSASRSSDGTGSPIRPKGKDGPSPLESATGTPSDPAGTVRKASMTLCERLGTSMMYLC